MNKKIAYAVILVCTGYLLFQWVQQPFMYFPMMFHHYGYYDSEPSLLMTSRGVVSFISLVAIVGSIVYILISNVSNHITPLQALQQRLAVGDITLEEYHVLKQEIE